jgi:hypothetical protein
MYLAWTFLVPGVDLRCTQGAFPPVLAAPGRRAGAEAGGGAAQPFTVMHGAGLRPGASPAWTRTRFRLLPGERRWRPWPCGGRAGCRRPIAWLRPIITLLSEQRDNQAASWHIPRAVTSLRSADAESGGFTPSTAGSSVQLSCRVQLRWVWGEVRQGAAVALPSAAGTSRIHFRYILVPGQSEKRDPSCHSLESTS